MCIGHGAWACHEWLADAFDGKLSGAVLHIFTVASGCCG